MTGPLVSLEKVSDIYKIMVFVCSEQLFSASKVITTCHWFSAEGFFLVDGVNQNADVNTAHI